MTTGIMIVPQTKSGEHNSLNLLVLDCFLLHPQEIMYDTLCLNIICILVAFVGRQPLKPS